MSSLPGPAGAAAIVDRMASRVVLGLTALMLFTPALGFSWPAFVLGVVLVAIPASMAERVLATTSGQKPLITGMQMLTRDADAARGWRIIGWSSLLASWLALVLVAYTAGSLGGQVIATLADQRDGIWSTTVQAPLFTLLLLWVAGVRSQYHIPMLVWLVPLTLLLFALMIQMAAGVELPLLDSRVRLPALPAPMAMLWGALTLCGGVGAIWSQAPARKQTAPRPFWMAAILIGVFAFIGLQFGAPGLFTALLGSTVCMLGLTSLLAPSLAVLSQRGLGGWTSVAVVLVPVALAAEYLNWRNDGALLACLTLLLGVWMALNMLLQSVFAGWVMKVSHGRKALELPSELSYNIWRVLARWSVPLLLALTLFQALRP